MNDTWKTPLKEIADPFGSMHKLAEDYAEVPFAEQLAATASASSFAEAYRLILTALSGATKFDDGESADDLLAMEDGATTAAERNVSLFSAAVDYCRGRNTAVKDSAKKNAWQKCQTHLSAWRAAFSDAPGAIATAIVIDELLHETRAPLSVDEAVAVVRREGVANEDSLAEIVRWYLFDIRKKYRKDIEIKVSQVECPKCRGKHDEGAECPHCLRAEAALGEAKKALSAKRWKDAEDKANEILGIWKSNADATEIRDKARSGAEAERKAAEEEVKKANAAIQEALGSGDFRSAWNKVDESRGVPGFKADEWRQKISQAEAKAKAEKLKDDQKKAKEQYEAALNDGRWDDAAMRAHERERLGDGKFETYKAEIDQWKAKRREKLEEACTKAIDDFKRSIPTNLDAAEAALNRAETAVKALEKEFSGSSRISSTKNDIRTGRSDIVQKRRDNIVNDLRPVQSLTASGSTDGKPTITISWKPGVGGTQVAKWRIWRREKGASGKGVKVDELNASTTSYADRGTGLKVGVEYEYGVVPMAEVDKTCRENEKAIVWSQPAVCLVRLPNDALSGTGQGMDGAGGIVTLQWKLPDGLPGGVPHRFLISRGDGKFSGKDVTDSNGIFEDCDVSVGKTFDYSLRFELCGRDMGTAKASVSVRKVQPPTPVGKFSFKRSAQGTVLVCWVWPEGLDSCLWGVADREAARPADIPKTAQRRVSRAVFDEKGGVTPAMPPGGAPCWLSVFGIRSFGDREFFSAGRSVPLRETVLEYSLETNPGGLFSKRKPAFLTIRSSTGYIPDLEVRSGKNRTEVLSRRGGRIALAVAQESSTPEKRIALEGAVSPGEFVRVYLAHPDAENCKLKHPPEFEVK